MIEKRFYKVKELSKLAGVSVRTLHYYDEIGLLKAKRNQTNGYRFYSLSDAVCLQQIILYRKLDISLEEIQKIITTSDSLMETLENQHALMLQRQTETQSIIKNLEVAMSALRDESNIDILFKSMPKEKAERWKKELMNPEKGGASVIQAYGGFSESEMEEKAALSDHWCKRYASILSKNIFDDSVQDLVGEAYVISNQAIAMIEPEQAHTFLDSEGFRKYTEINKTNKVLHDMYEHYSDGFADHLYRAMLYFCDNQLENNPNYWKKKVQQS